MLMFMATALCRTEHDTANTNSISSPAPSTSLPAKHSHTQAWTRVVNNAHSYMKYHITVYTTKYLIIMTSWHVPDKQ